MLPAERIKLPTLSEFFKGHVFPKHKVLCVGAMTKPEEDPSVLQACTIAKEVHILDAQSPLLRDKLATKKINHIATKKELKLLNRLTQLTKNSSGAGDPVKYIQSLEELSKKYGIKTSTPEIHFRDVIKTKFRKNKFDVLIDAGSLYWIVKGHTDIKDSNKVINVFLHEKQKREFRKKVLREYARISKTAIFLSPDTEAHIQDLKRELEAMGAKVSEQRVNNFYEIPSEKLSLTLSHRHRYDYALVAEFGEKKARIKRLFK